MAATKKKEKKNAMAVINQHIKTGEFAKIYLLYGEERYLVNQYRDKLLSALTDKDDNLNFGGDLNMSVRNEIKAQIVRAGFTMQEVVDLLHDEYGWSDSVFNLSAKLQRESIRYKEVVELADALGYEIYRGPRKGDAFVGRGGAAERMNSAACGGVKNVELATTRQKRREK